MRIPVALRAGTGARRAETLPLEIGDRELWLSITGVGFAEGTVYAFRDLTEERALEKMRSDFVATISHELRTPLASDLRRGGDADPARRDARRRTSGPACSA